MFWNDSLVIGIEELDEHHKQLVSLLNSVYSNFTLGADKSGLSSIITELIRYTKYHFSAEEKWMKDHQYPGIEKHIEEHSRFYERVSRFQNDFAAGNALLTLDLFQFLQNWLTVHILNTDAAMGRFAREERLSAHQ